MATLIISILALIIASVALYRTFKPADKIELRVNDDLTELKDWRLNTRGVEIKNINKTP
jgi:hypothetical protein